MCVYTPEDKRAPPPNSFSFGNPYRCDLSRCQDVMGGFGNEMRSSVYWFMITRILYRVWNLTGEASLWPHDRKSQETTAVQPPAPIVRFVTSFVTTPFLGIKAATINQNRKLPVMLHDHAGQELPHQLLHQIAGASPPRIATSQPFGRLGLESFDVFPGNHALKMLQSL